MMSTVNDLETQKALCCFEDHQQETKSRTCWQLQHLAEILCIDNDAMNWDAYPENPLQ